MAENVVLSVQLSGAESAIAQLTQLDGIVKSLKSNGKISINVNARSLGTAAANAEKLNSGLTGATNAAKQVGTTGARGISTASQELQKASRNVESFRIGMGSVVANMAKFRLASTAINLVANAFKEAFNEMKAVDKELVNIRKVTGFSNAEIEKLSKNAYSLATNYGRSASEVLQASTVFARAGYTDQIGQLSELSLLLQNVGDLTAEEASRFVIATDKAYKLGGSYEDLMTIIDGLDNITNKNATDMQKMTEGMTVAGSVFAESGESIETFAALLGTATADTQRSGSEVARGLRTILMNLRQIRGETEDGELIDGESWASAAKALRDYANISTMENGQLRKASDVLAELASKWNTLTETQQAAVAEAVGGKRQANILMALMGDWSSYEKMLGEFQNAAGTAAKENAAYMDSWEAKTAQLKASWSELVATVTDTNALKDFIDLGTQAVGVLNNFAKSPAFEKIMSFANRGINQWMGMWSGTLDRLGFILSDNEERAENAAEAAAKLQTEYDKLQEEYNRDFGAGSRYDELRNGVANLTVAEREELSVLEAQRQEREKALAAAKQELENAQHLAKITLSYSDKKREEKAQRYNENLSSFLNDANKDFLASYDFAAYKSDLSDIIALYGEYYQSLIETKNAGKELTEQETQFVEAFSVVASEHGNAVQTYGAMTAAAARASGESWEYASIVANEAMDSIAEDFDLLPNEKTIELKVAGVESVKAALAAVSAALGGLNGTINLSGFAGGTSNAPGGPALVNENGPEMISANGLAYIAGGGRPTITMLPRGATVLTAKQTRNALRGRSFNGIRAYKNGTGGDSDAAIAAFLNAFQNSEPQSSSYDYYGASSFQQNNQYPHGRKTGATGIADPIKARPRQSNGGGGGENSPAAPTPPDFKKLEEELSDLLKNLDLQAKLAENQEDFLKAMQIYGEAQDYIGQLLDQYRANGYAEDSNEVLRLANLGYDYAAKQLGGYDKLQQNLINALNALTDSTDKANELQERQEAVEKARETLANAERQRTVRIFNPVTGQWEWVANASDITRAQENLKNAEAALRKEELSQAVSAIKNADASELGNMTLSPAVLEALFGGTPEQQNAFLQALGAASGGADWLSSSAAQTAWNQGTSIGTQYNLGNITLTEAQASGMTIKELINMLQGLKIM